MQDRFQAKSRQPASPAARGSRIRCCVPGSATWCCAVGGLRLASSSSSTSRCASKAPPCCRMLEDQDRLFDQQDRLPRRNDIRRTATSSSSSTRATRPKAISSASSPSPATACAIDHGRVICSTASTLPEPYVPSALHRRPARNPSSPWVPGEYFVMGDHRSRSPATAAAFGPVDRSAHLWQSRLRLLARRASRRRPLTKTASHLHKLGWHIEPDAERDLRCILY